MLIILSIIVIDNKDGWPTIWVLLPIVGAWMCIAANNEKSLLSNQVLQKIGIWSYAIYLVHWPFLVYVNALGLAKYSFIWILPIFCLGILLHYTVERKRSYGYKFLLLYVGTVAVIVSAEKMRLYNSIKANTFEAFEEYGGTYIPEGTSMKIGANEPAFILQGDSHSRELVTALHNRGLSFISSNQNNCYSIGKHVKVKDIGVNDETERKCNDLYRKTLAIADIYNNIPLIVVQNWSVYALNTPQEQGQNTKPFHVMNNFDSKIPPEQFESFIFEDILKLSEDFYDRTIYVVGKKQENPYFESGYAAFNNMLSVWAKRNLTQTSHKFITAKQHRFSINDALRSSVKRINNMRSGGAKLANLVFVEPNVHCKNGICNLFINDTVQIYSDGHHYSFAGAEKAVTNLLNIMNIDPSTKETDFQDFECIRNITYTELDLLLS